MNPVDVFRRRALALVAAGVLCGEARSALPWVSDDGRWARPAAPVVLYETGFEAWEGFDPTLDLAGQGGWLAVGTGGNGLLEGPVEGFQGQVAYVGFSPPGEGDGFLNVFRPVGLAPVGGHPPILTFTVSFQITDSTTDAPHFDDFRWSAYNTEDQRLFTLDFDNEALEIHFVLDDEAGFRSTGFAFRSGEPYDLEVRMNLARNLWTATLNGAVLVNAQPITTRSARLDLGSIDAVWAVRDPDNPGDNFMMFDDYRLVGDSAAEIPPVLEAVGRLTDGRFLVRVLGEPGIRYAVEASGDLSHWEPVGTVTAQSPGGTADLQDLGAVGSGARFYRAYSVP